MLTVDLSNFERHVQFLKEQYPGRAAVSLKEAAQALNISYEYTLSLSSRNELPFRVCRIGRGNKPKIFVSILELAKVLANENQA